MQPSHARLAVLTIAAVAVLGACGKATDQKSGGTVKPASSSESTTSTTAAPSTMVTTAKPATTSTTARATTTTEKVTTTTAPAASSVSYANCSAVKAAGAAPLHRDDPGYSSKLDRDGDGVACES